MQEGNSEKKRKYRLVITIILFIYTLLFIGGAIAWPFIYARVSEDNTTEFTAIVSDIRPIGFYRIATDEKNAYLMIFLEETVVNMNILSDLSVGQQIIFRVRNRNINMLNDSSQSVELVSLKIDGVDVITLGSFNSVIQTMRIQATVGFAVGGILFLLLTTISFLWYNEKFNAKK